MAFMSGFYLALMTGRNCSFLHFRSAAGELTAGADMAERKMDGFRQSWMVTLILLSSLTEVRQTGKY